MRPATREEGSREERSATHRHGWGRFALVRPAGKGFDTIARRRWPRPAMVVAVAALTLSVTGCGSLAEAQQVIGRADLVNDLSARLSSAEQLTYTADYQLPGGRSSTIAREQKPPRSVYAYPGGRLIVTADATIECTDKAATTTCRQTLPPSPSANPAAGLFSDPGAHGMIPPTVVVTLLTAAALDSDAVIRQHDTTVAGQHATCVEVDAVENAPASAFDACVTTSGVLGSFSGLVNGKQIELALTRYSDTIPAGTFDLPANATLTDSRPRTK